jgi:hypothetical protein
MRELFQQGFAQIGIIIDKQNPASDHGIILQRARSNL